MDRKGYWVKSENNHTNTYSHYLEGHMIGTLGQLKAIDQLDVSFKANLIEKRCT